MIRNLREILNDSILAVHQEYLEMKHGKLAPSLQRLKCAVRDGNLKDLHLNDESYGQCIKRNGAKYTLAKKDQFLLTTRCLAYYRNDLNRFEGNLKDKDLQVCLRLYLFFMYKVLS